MNDFIFLLLILFIVFTFFISIFQMIFLFVPIFPLYFNRYHYIYRIKIILSLIFIEISIIFFYNAFEFTNILLIALSFISIFITKKIHPENIFKTITAVTLEKNISDSIYPTGSKVIVVTKDNVTRAYPLSYVSLHHVIHDRELLITFCPLCNSANVFDQSNIKSTFKVATLEKGNMIIIDKKTKSYWQQATGDTLIGPSHPKSMELYDYDIMSLRIALETFSDLQLVKIKKSDLNFLPFLQRKIFPKLRNRSSTMGYRNENHDKRLPPFTRVIGISKNNKNYVIKIESDIVSSKLMKVNEVKGYLFIGKENKSYFSNIDETIDLDYDNEENLLYDRNSNRKWNLLGNSLVGDTNLKREKFEDVFWFHWASFHPNTTLLD